MKKPLLFLKTYFPKKGICLMKNVGDVAKARDDFLKNKPSNLAFLLEKRYDWMNAYVKPYESGIELGAGPGFSKLYIKAKNFILTDFEKNDWIDKKVDALNMPFEDSSLDYIISSNTIHHLSSPYKFFNESSRVLRKGGKLIIQEINASFATRFFLRLMRHEGYSYKIDVFDEESICGNSFDPWSANCAIPNLLFDDMAQFEKSFPFKIQYHRYTEFLIFVLSGGVIAKIKTINLPYRILKLIDKFDDFLITVSKNIFSMQRNIVLENMK